MNFEQYKKDFTLKASKNGFSHDSIISCLNYSEKLFNNNAPVIYEINHLSSLVGYNTSYIKRATISTYFFYKHFKIKKKKVGSFRLISEPLPSLKEIQYFILNEILYKQKVSKFCKSYIPKKKITEYLRYHVNEKQILTLDIDNFFSSLKFQHVLNVFIQIGYSNDLAETLAKLCTLTNKEEIDNDQNRFLPQGAPTSPYLSNIILHNFDDVIATYCKKNNLKYTRYADDMAFSGENINKDEIIKLVCENLNFIGLNLNIEKSNFMLQNQKQIISGIVVNNKMQLPKKERRELRNIIYHIRTKTLNNHIVQIGESRENYLYHLIGRIQYGLNINPKDAKLQEYKEYLLNMLKNEK